MKLLRNCSAAFFIATALLARLAPSTYAQSEIGLDTVYSGTSTNSTATTNGLFWIQTNGSAAVLINQDFNAAFYGGTNSTNLTLISTFLLSNGSAIGDNMAGPGTFLDPTGAGRIIAGASDSAFFQIQAWLGNYTNYSSAVAAGAYARQSPVFSNSMAGPPGTPPDLTAMPALVLTAGGGGSAPISGGGPSSSGSPPSGPPDSPGPFDPGSTSVCGLWLEVNTTNSVANLYLHGVRPGQNYQVFSIQSLGSTNWTLETNFTAGASDPALTLIATGGRTSLFFRAQEYRYYVTNSVFPGLNYSNSGAANPDSMGAAGPSNYVELINRNIAVYDKSGTNASIAQTNMSGFFAVSGASMTDPRILYDTQSQRWVATAIDQTSLQVLLAVSITSSPTNLDTGWTRYVVQVAQDGSPTDFDTLGFDANGIYLSVLHPASITNFHTVVAIKKPEIYNGTNISTTFKVSTNDLLAWTIQPAVNFDSIAPNGYAWFVAKGPPNLSSNYYGGGIVYRRGQWSGTNFSWADASWLTVSSSTDYQDYYDLDGTNISRLPTNGISAPQANGTVDLYDVGSRLAAATIRNGFLWTCQTIGLSTNTGIYVGDPSGSNVTRSAMQWLKLQISPDGSSLSLADHGRVFDSSQTNPWWYYFPSLMVNCAGDMVAGFSGSTTTKYVSTFATWRLANGVMLGQPAIIQPGTTTSGATNIVTRWGDYSTTTLDPTDDWSFWTVQEFAEPYVTNTRTNNQWGTVIARIRPNP